MASEEDESHAWMVGVALAVGAAGFTNVGINLQKLSHRKREEATLLTEKRYSRTLWIVGIFLMILGAIADFIALGLAAQSIVAPLGSLTLVFNVYVARWMHGEVITPSGIKGTFIILFGVLLSVFFAPHRTPISSVDQVLSIYSSLRFTLYILVISIFITYLWISAQKYATGLSSTQTQALFKRHRLFVAMLSGILGAHNVLFAKFTAKLLMDGLSVVMMRFMFYVTIFLLCFTVSTQLKWLNEGLKRFNALYMVPVSKAFWVLFSVISGLIVFEEYKNMSFFHFVLFVASILVILFGVKVFSSEKIVDVLDGNKKYETANSTGPKAIKEEMNALL